MKIARGNARRGGLSREKNEISRRAETFFVSPGKPGRPDFERRRFFALRFSPNENPFRGPRSARSARFGAKAAKPFGSGEGNVRDLFRERNAPGRVEKGKTARF
jgi:hypothetical protein